MLGADQVSIQYGDCVLHFEPHEHEYHLEKDGKTTKLQGITGYLKAAGYYEPYGDNGEMSAKFGSYVHEAVYLYNAKDLYKDVHPLIQDRLNGWIDFCKENDFVPDLRWCEKPIYHPGLLYGTHCDAVGTIKGSRAIVEVKTGQYMNWHRIQVTAQRMALAELDPNYKDAQRWLVYLKEGGKHRPIEVDDSVEYLFACIVASEDGKTLYGPRSKSLNKRKRDDDE